MGGREEGREGEKCQLNSARRTVAGNIHMYI